jgi:hypothetical protein
MNSRSVLIAQMWNWGFNMKWMQLLCIEWDYGNQAR